MATPKPTRKSLTPLQEDLLSAYCNANRQSQRAVELYRNRFPTRTTPEPKAFTEAYQQLLKLGRDDQDERIEINQNDVSNRTPFLPSPLWDAYTQFLGLDEGQRRALTISTSLPKEIVMLNEYSTRHDLDGRFLPFEEFRFKPITGYEPEKLFYRNAFDFMVEEDKVFVQLSLKNMIDRRDKYGFSWCRLKTASGIIKYLHTVGEIEVKYGNVTLVCRNKILTAEEGQAGLAMMRREFEAYLGVTQPPAGASARLPQPLQAFGLAYACSR